MIKLREAVIVEGKYDKIKLSGLLDTVILTTDGFGIFKDKEKQRLIRRIARERGILVMTDSDSAGFVIRSFLSGIVDPSSVTHVYIPDILGKEKRKDAPSKEGKLGVEGVNSDVILDALRRAGVTAEPCLQEHARRTVTKTDFMEDGLSGGQNSAEKRRALLRVLDLPERTSANAMLKIINTFMTYEEYKAAVAEIEAKQ